jgi:hypothetical protein
VAIRDGRVLKHERDRNDGGGKKGDGKDGGG